MHVSLIKLSEIRSYLYKDILREWKPNLDYIDHLKNEILNGEYIPPILVVKDDSGYTIITGAHRVYAHLLLGKESIKAVELDGSYESLEPVRKAEVLLKEYDRATQYKYNFSEFLHIWAAAVDKNDYSSKYSPRLSVAIYFRIQAVLDKIRQFCRRVTSFLFGQ